MGTTTLIGYWGNGRLSMTTDGMAMYGNVERCGEGGGGTVEYCAAYVLWWCSCAVGDCGVDSCDY